MFANKPVEADFDSIPVYHPLMNHLKPGDIFCTQNPMALGKAICLLESCLSPDRNATYSHSGIIIDSIGTTLEADWFVEQFCLFQKFSGCDVLIARHNEMDTDKFLAGIKGISRNIGDLYPLVRLLLCALNLAQFIHWNSVVCSELAAKFLFKAELRGYKYFGVTPDNLADEILQTLNQSRTGPQYTIIHQGVLGLLLYKKCFDCGRYMLAPDDQSQCCNCGHTAIEPALFKDRSRIDEILLKRNEVQRKVFMKRNNVS